MVISTIGIAASLGKSCKFSSVFIIVDSIILFAFAHDAMPNILPTGPQANGHVRGLPRPLPCTVAEPCPHPIVPLRVVLGSRRSAALSNAASFPPPAPRTGPKRRLSFPFKFVWESLLVVGIWGLCFGTQFFPGKWVKICISSDSFDTSQIPLSKICNTDVSRKGLLPRTPANDNALYLALHS